MTQERKSIIGTEVDMESNVITFTVAGAGSVQLLLGKCGEEMAKRAAFHGYEQKVRDAAAIPRDTKTGRSASPQEKLSAMEQVVGNLHAGLWNVRVAAASLNRACLFAAIASVRGVAPEKVEAKFRGYEDKVLQTFLTHRDIAAEYSRLTAPQVQNERAEALLSTLDE